MRRSTTLLLALVVAMPPLLAACGDTDDRTGADAAAAEDGHDDGGHDDTSPVAEGAREIQVTASSFAFDPGEIRVTAGDEIAIALTSADVMHDFTIDELDAHVVADVGETVAGGLRADEPGEYTYYCAVPGHRAAGMEGTLIVEAP